MYNLVQLFQKIHSVLKRYVPGGDSLDDEKRAYTTHFTSKLVHYLQELI